MPKTEDEYAKEFAETITDVFKDMDKPDIKLKTLPQLTADQIEQVEDLVFDLIPEIEGSYIRDTHIGVKDGEVFCDVLYFEKEKKPKPEPKNREPPPEPASLEEPEYYTEVFKAVMHSDDPEMDIIMENSRLMPHDLNVRSIGYSQDYSRLPHMFIQTVTYFKKPEDKDGKS